ncbi:MAG TPA: FAD-dependent oxidoreductase [Dehalococcoidia bacterium]|nr:FAD-dependent oxidoreductase [Dehalococcoidia bacterium]
MSKLEKLFEPIRIGKMELKNRMVMAPINSHLGTELGGVNQRLVDYYVARARGGVGLIITDAMCVDWPVGKAGTSPLRIDEWKYVNALHDLTDAVHEYGVKLAAQIHHAGRQNSMLVCAEGQELVAPSAIPCLPTGGDMPRELTIEEIEELINKFIMAAQRARAAGFDAVEVHGAHGYLITQFMSPHTNKRTDEYGSDFEGRMRFPLRIVEGIRASVGPDYPILFRMCADEYIEGGLTLEDSKIIAQRLEAAGVDALDITSGIYESPPAWHAWIYPIYDMAPGCRVYLAEEIKKAVGIPVIASGKLGDPVMAEAVIRDGKADLVAIGRALLADPELPVKAVEGRLDDIRPCIYCDESCVGGLSHLWHIDCQVNPDLGRESEFEVKQAEKAKRVLIVGGGPAGMEAARVAALRGHEVTLHEKENRLGGQLIAASVPQFKKPINNLIEYFKNQLDRHGVNIELGRETTPEFVRELKPDVVILATGASHIIPDMPGFDSGNVVTASEILLDQKEAGNRVAIIGGGEVGSELAWYLAEQGKKVSIIEMQYAVASDVNLFSRFYLLNKLAELGVEMAVGMTAEEVMDKGVLAVDMAGNRKIIEADTVVLAVGFKPNHGFAEELKGVLPERYAVGDCSRLGKIKGAIHGGARVAHRI